MKLAHFISILCLFIFLIGCKAKMDVEMEKSNPLEGTTWEMVSAKYTWGDSTLICPMSKYHKGMGIWGKKHTIAIWQDTSRQDIFCVGHKYTVENDTVAFTIKFWPDATFIGQSFRLKYEIKEDQLILSGIMPQKKWNIGDHNQGLYEVWKRID